MSRRNLETVFARAYEAHQTGRDEEAERLYKRILRSNPRDSDARNLLGLLYLQQQRFAESAQEISRALALRPNDPHSHYNLGAALLGGGDPGSAVQNFRMSCAADPTNAAARAALSVALNDLGTQCANPHEAMLHHAEALEIDPTNSRAAINLGILQEQTGDFDAAAKSFQQALRTQPDFADAHFQLAHLKQHQSSDEEIAAMIALFGRTEGKEKALLAHGIAKALEKQERYAEEFGWLKKAHATMESVESYDEGRTRRWFESLRQTRANEFATGDRGAELAFVVGMPRSGTSLAEQILASHPEIHGAGEVLAVADLTVSPATTDKELARLAQVATDRVSEGAANASLYVETTPTNFLRLGRIAMLFPAARIIHCVRHPLDTCLSIFQHPLSEAHAYSHDLASLGRYYLEYQRLMTHWRKVLPNPMFDLQYESVIDDLDGTVRQLLAFCGVDFDPACLQFHTTERRVRTPSASQVRQPIYRSSVGRWRRYEEALTPLTEVLESEGPSP